MGELEWWISPKLTFKENVLVDELPLVLLPRNVKNSRLFSSAWDHFLQLDVMVIWDNVIFGIAGTSSALICFWELGRACRWHLWGSNLWCCSSFLCVNCQLSVTDMYLSKPCYKRLIQQLQNKSSWWRDGSESCTHLWNKQSIPFKLVSFIYLAS